MTLLERTPRILRSMLQDLPLELAAANEGDQTWSPFDVLGHLIHGERTDWIPRLKILMESGESRAFDPFDMYAQFEASKGKTIEELLDTFYALRSESIRALSEMRIGPDDLARTGKHPELGRVTLEELLATWVAHDLDHIVQISRTMAKQYRESVGPWQQYLSILK
jgi:hypothetical protein